MAKIGITREWHELAHQLWGHPLPHPDDDDDEFCVLDWLFAVNSNPDVDPDEDDDTIGHSCDEMSHWDLGESTLEDGGEEEDDEWPF